MQFHEYGADQKQTILLLHGGGLSWWNYREAAELLQGDYHVILPILDGHAGSDRPFTTIEDNAAELIRFVDEHLGGSVLLIGGLSLGGQVLLEILSQRRNICSYALIESAAVIPSKLTNALIAPAFGTSYWLIRNRSFCQNAVPVPAHQTGAFRGLLPRYLPDRETGHDRFHGGEHVLCVEGFFPEYRGEGACLRRRKGDRRDPALCGCDLPRTPVGQAPSPAGAAARRVFDQPCGPVRRRRPADRPHASHPGGDENVNESEALPLPEAFTVPRAWRRKRCGERKRNHGAERRSAIRKKRVRQNGAPSNCLQIIRLLRGSSFV